MAIVVCKNTDGTMTVKIEDGSTRRIAYNELKQAVLANRITLDNMYINEKNRLCFIRNEELDNIRKELISLDKNVGSTNRKAGWHSGGLKKPYGFYNNYR